MLAAAPLLRPIEYIEGLLTLVTARGDQLVARRDPTSGKYVESKYIFNLEDLAPLANS